jgi:hypothetical protein
MYWNGIKSIKTNFWKIGSFAEGMRPQKRWSHWSNIDLSSALEGPAFQQLQDITVFAQLRVDKELDTIVWPNGADFAPEFLYFQAFKNVPDLQAQFRQWGYIA